MRRLLTAVLPRDDAPVVLGDLEEGYHHRARAQGPRAARRWYRREALVYAARFAPGRLRLFLAASLGTDMTRDLRFALRGLVRQPGFALVVVTTLAVGIGANATVFGVVDAVLFRPLPVAEPDRLVAVYGSSERDGNAGGMFQGFLPTSYPNFEDLRDAATSVDAMYVHSQWPISVAADGGESERVDGLYVSASFFDALGVRPALGRAFRPDEDRHPGADAVVVLQHGFWQRRFGADPAVLGRTLTVNGRAMEIIGVAPPGFRGVTTTLEPAVFVPVSMVGDVPPWGPLWTLRGLRFFMVGARMAPGRTLADVRAEMDALGARLAETYPDANANRGVQVLPLSEAQADPNDGAALSRTGGVLLLMAGLVLLIASMNVANLLMARALSRGREMAVRSSLGATRGHLARQLALESGLLFALGAGAGVALTVVLVGVLADVRPPAFGGGSLDVRLDPRVLGFTLAVTFAAAAVFGVGPSLRAAGGSTAGRLRTRGSGATTRGRRLRDVLVMGQVALSVVALVAAGSFVRSLQAARSIDPGFSLEGLGLMEVDLAAQGYGQEEMLLFYQRMAETTAALPSVASAAVGGARPLAPAPLRRAVRAEDDRSDTSTGHFVRVEPVTPGFFATLELDILEGRALDDGDRADRALVAVPNRRMADMLWPGESPLARRLTLSLVDDPIEVVGVARTAKAVSLDEEPQPILYVPMEQHGAPAATLFVRMRSAGGLEDARRAVQALDPALPVFGVATAEEVVAEDLWTARATAGLLGLFGAIGLFLAAVGIYGVVAHSVRERRREMGLRLALGSGRRRVLTDVVGRALAVAGVGAVAGAVAGVAVTGAFSGILVGVESTDPGPVAAVVVALLLVAACAAWIPAGRATRVDPMLVLRGE